MTCDQMIDKVYEDLSALLLHLNGTITDYKNYVRLLEGQHDEDEKKITKLMVESESRQDKIRALRGEIAELKEKLKRC